MGSQQSGIVGARKGEVVRLPEHAVESNLGLVLHIVAQHRNCWVPTRDLFQEGAIGLIRAARRFEPGRERPFASYAGFWIRKYIREAIFRESSFVHVPYGKRREIDRMPAASYLRPGIPANLSPAEESDPSVKKPGRVKKTAPPIVLRRQPFEEEAIGAVLIGENGCASNPMKIDPEGILLRQERSEIVRAAVSCLNSVEQAVISRRFGFDDGEPEALDCVGQSLGLTRQRVHQIERQAKKRLRTRLRRVGWMDSR